MSREDELQLERMIEVIARAIPKEHAAAKLYHDTGRASKREMVRMLFSRLGNQAEEHEVKLRSAMEILRKELQQLKANPQQPVPADACSAEFNVNIRRTLRLATDMQELAGKGLEDANDPSCRALYETMQKMALELRGLAGEEVEKHIDKEKWD